MYYCIRWIVLDNLLVLTEFVKQIVQSSFLFIHCLILQSFLYITIELSLSNIMYTLSDWWFLYWILIINFRVTLPNITWPMTKQLLSNDKYVCALLYTLPSKMLPGNYVCSDKYLCKSRASLEVGMWAQLTSSSLSVLLWLRSLCMCVVRQCLLFALVVTIYSVTMVTLCCFSLYFSNICVCSSMVVFYRCNYCFNRVIFSFHGYPIDTNLGK